MNAKRPDDSRRNFSEWAEDSKEKMSGMSDEIREGVDEFKETFQEAREKLLLQLAETTSEIKPLFRGWVHLVSAPFMMVGCLILLVLVEDVKSRAGIAFFAFGAISLLSVSSIYHRSNGWVNTRIHLLLQKMDHTGISILIACSATGLALILLESNDVIVLMATMWPLALLASLIRFFFPRQFPKYVSVAIYVLLGWIPIFFLPKFYTAAILDGGNSGVIAFWLIALGGLFYTVGAGLFYGVRPKIWHKENVWTYHENFHMFTVLALICHFSSFALLALG